MESQYSLLVAMWLTTWVMIQWRVFIPSMLILGKMDNSNASYRWWPATWIIFGLGSFITIPIMILPALSDGYRDIFVKGYVNSLFKVEL